MQDISTTSHLQGCRLADRPYMDVSFEQVDTHGDPSHSAPSLVDVASNDRCPILLVAIQRLTQLAAIIYPQ